jgi:hypothetical protein
LRRTLAGASDARRWRSGCRGSRRSLSDCPHTRQLFRAHDAQPRAFRRSSGLRHRRMHLLWVRSVRAYHPTTRGRNRPTGFPDPAGEAAGFDRYFRISRSDTDGLGCAHFLRFSDCAGGCDQAREGNTDRSTHWHCIVSSFAGSPMPRKKSRGPVLNAALWRLKAEVFAFRKDVRWGGGSSLGPVSPVARGKRRVVRLVER